MVRLPEFEHVPVLPDAIRGLYLKHAPSLIVDGTLGGAGHATIALDALPAATLIGLDRDPDAIEAATKTLSVFGSRAKIVSERFSNIRAVLDTLGVSSVGAMLVDVGVSSFQLDEGSRGFSFRSDAPLDMRMDPTRGESAAELIARLDVDELAAILREFGEERQAKRIARAMVEDKPTRTLELAEMIERVAGYRGARERIHPATRTFQALRIAVNDELGELDRWLDAIPACLSPGGIAMVISFHSLEDRRVKNRFRDLTSAPSRSRHLPEVEAPSFDFELLTRKPITATDAEIEANSRSRTAKLRGIRRKERQR